MEETRPDGSSAASGNVGSAIGVGSRFFFEAESIYKEEDFPKSSRYRYASKDGSSSSSTAKPKRTKKVKVMVNKRLKYLLEKRPTKPLDLKRLNPALEASTQRMIEWEKDILRQFETMGYAVYEREVEVTDDEEELQQQGSGSSNG